MALPVISWPRGGGHSRAEGPAADAPGNTRSFRESMRRARSLSRDYNDALERAPSPGRRHDRRRRRRHEDRRAPVRDARRRDSSGAGGPRARRARAGRALVPTSWASRCSSTAESARTIASRVTRCVVGVVKSHRTLYAEGAGLQVVFGLRAGERTTAFRVTSPKRTTVASWYLRLRDPLGRDPMWGLGARRDRGAVARDAGPDSRTRRRGVAVGFSPRWSARAARCAMGQDGLWNS